jgi:hypothetical protein
MIPEGIGLQLPTPATGASGRPHLDICPPSLQDKDFLATAERRPVPYSEVLTTAIQGLTSLDAHVVVASGRLRPEQLGTLPDNVTVQA